MENQKKNNPVKTLLTIVISIAVAVFFMWLAFRGLKFGEIKGYFAKANYLWVAAAAVFGVLAYWFRAIRWNLLFEPLGYKISNSNSFWTIAFGYLMNLTIPRSGEVARATALYGVEKVPVDKSFGTIILERVVDLICMIAFLGLTLIFKYDAILAFYKQSNINISPNKIFVILGVLTAGAIAFFVFRNRFINVPVLGNVIKIINGILDGVFSIFKLKQPVLFVVYSVAIWICYYLAAYLICFALPETSHFTFADGFFVIVVGTLGMMIPASGGIGAFHFALKLGIGALFLSMGKSFAEGEEVGLAYAFISHTMQLVLMVVLGFISIPILTKARNAASKNEKFQ
ncbi:lysylphosphatidylglycerol synthase transmembrane domain-containing protein [uncultured Chryseobacterium sp.]|uniref:lysylphosphatidylglycerol synthase transmembrane domain-containing protein n=1 Tax=uncultured Chryseobacterium sp. TaxID=259322 RepID=UPI00262C23A5|nr:lysylphosphatidylglycerol synthase transmembrane domain-containing protein [uncultured Chryseobacterium sp.]